MNRAQEIAIIESWRGMHGGLGAATPMFTAAGGSALTAKDLSWVHGLMRELEPALDAYDGRRHYVNLDGALFDASRRTRDHFGAHSAKTRTAYDLIAAYLAHQARAVYVPRVRCENNPADCPMAGLSGLGDAATDTGIPMGTLHVILATGSFALGALGMHLLHRYKVMK